MAGKAVYAALLAVQQNLKAPKGQYNSFGKYKYRSCEDILQAARPLCNENGLIITIQDDVEHIGGRFYIRAIAKVTDIATGESVENAAYAREDDTKKGMDAAQITGACSSYARKYALCGLFAIDDNKDADTDEFARQKPQEGAGKATAQKPTQDKGAQDEMRKKALAALNDRVKALKIEPCEVTALIGAHYDKMSTKEMTVNEICDLANNIKKYIEDAMGVPLGTGA